MNIRRNLLKFLAASPLFANYTASADSQSKGQVVDLSWGHININVSNLDASIEFYEKIGFEVFLPVIPYLELAEIAICIYWATKQQISVRLMRVNYL